jgi:hypothetical protein
MPIIFPIELLPGDGISDADTGEALYVFPAARTFFRKEQLELLMIQLAHGTAPGTS